MSQSTSAVALDATHFATGRPTGVERYVDALLPRLSRRLQQSGASVTWIGHAPQAPAGMPTGVGWTVSPYRRFWSQTGLRQLVADTTPSLFFTPSGLPPLHTKTRTVLTVHDLAVYAAPEAFSVSQRFRQRQLVRAAARAASHVIVPSRFTSEQVNRLWKLAPEKVSAVPEGFVDPEVAAEAVGSLGGVPFFVFVGRLERKKNLSTVVEGFARLVAEQDCRLVLAGSPGYGYAHIKQAIAALPSVARARVIEPGYVSDGQRRWLLENAVAGLVPSPYEGFGLPVLECFAAGCPVICAQAGALPELAADAAVYVQWDIATDWYLQMKAVLADAASVRPLVERGREYLKLYTWERTAELTSQVLLGHA
jgi:glycosyltransferase involved in cell wall biosynthesis